MLSADKVSLLVFWISCRISTLMLLSGCDRFGNLPEKAKIELDIFVRDGVFMMIGI